MPSKGIKYWGGNTVSSSPADSTVPAFHCFLFCHAVVPHSSVPSYPSHTLFFWCLCAALDTKTLSYGKIQGSFSASFLLSHLVVILEKQIPLSKMQRCSWFPPRHYSGQGLQSRAATARSNHQGKTIRVCKVLLLFQGGLPGSLFHNEQTEQTDIPQLVLQEISPLRIKVSGSWI